MKKNPKKQKQIMAWFVIILLITLVIATLIFALIDTPWSYTAFKMCLGTVIVLPVLLYIYTWAAKLGHKDDSQSNGGKNE